MDQDWTRANISSQASAIGSHNYTTTSTADSNNDSSVRVSGDQTIVTKTFTTGAITTGTGGNGGSAAGTSSIGGAGGAGGGVSFS
ncbi:unnamed protein product [Cyclocybe aegerita]|uniref:Uncharacterized protein n=1 Tax=Cyclocybe aegerita TaxID=1973307 RepID=A0A8S0WH06_CYCAE|nr:unnamed protein product [Cyclocybe aegerita]